MQFKLSIRTTLALDPQLDGETEAPRASEVTAARAVRVSP
jgi:hypothetical protein